MKYYCDNARHLVCIPYTVENLHAMAVDLNIKRCWYHSSKSGHHYDIPKRRIEEIKSKCIVVSSKDILKIINGTFEEQSTKDLFDVRQDIAERQANGEKLSLSEMNDMITEVFDFAEAILSSVKKHK